MPFLKLLPRAGIVRDPTAFTSEGAWYDCDKVRFRNGVPETINGWTELVSTKYLGVARYLGDWQTTEVTKYIGAGTTYKLYVNKGDSMYDISPVRTTKTLGTDPFATVNASGVVTVTSASHGAVVGDYVTFAGSTAVAGIAAATLNAEHRINSVTDANTYKILVGTAASSGTTGGGGSVTAAYQENVGLDTYNSGGSGWGAGAWGSAPWGGTRGLVASAQLRGWSMDNYGDDLLATPRAGTPCYWDESDAVTTRSTILTEVTRASATLGANPVATVNTSPTITITDNGGHDLGVGDSVTLGASSAVNGIPAAEINTTHTVTATPTDTTFQVLVTSSATSTGTGGGSSVTVTYYAGQYYCPNIGLAVMVSDQERHGIVFGANPIGSTVMDPLLVRWSTADNIAVWRPKLENLAGGQKLSSGSWIVAQAKTRQEIVIWTDHSIHSMRYVGAPFVYSFSELANDISIISPNAYSVAGDVIYFMGRGGFYRYSGAVDELVCPVEDYVFSDLNLDQAFKVYAGTNDDYGEVWWFYPSTTDNTGENSRYVIYNYRFDIWYFGTLKRSAWAATPTRQKPTASSIDYTTGLSAPITTSSGTGTVVVSYTAHDQDVGDIVIITGASAVGGLGSDVLNAQHTITAVTDDTFTFVVADSATSTATGGGDAVKVVLSSRLWKHDTGRSANGSTINAYIESTDIDLGEGDAVQHISRIIPDIKFLDPSGGADTVTLSLKGKNFPGDSFATIATGSILSSTSQVHVRGRARQIRLRAETTVSDFGWRLGSTRIDTREDGRR